MKLGGQVMHGLKFIRATYGSIVERIVNLFLIESMGVIGRGRGSPNILRVKFFSTFLSLIKY